MEKVILYGGRRYYYNNKGKPVKCNVNLATSKIEEYSKASYKFGFYSECVYYISVKVAWKIKKLVKHWLATK